MTELWYATRDVGQFRNGHAYTREQLGVLGRMARKAGLLVREPMTVMPAKRGRRKINGSSAVQAGSGSEVRNDSGAKVGPDDNVSGKPSGKKERARGGLLHGEIEEVD